MRVKFTASAAEKKTIKALLQNPEAPKLEYARLTRGESVLAVKEA